MKAGQKNKRVAKSKPTHLRRPSRPGTDHLPKRQTLTHPGEIRMALPFRPPNPQIWLGNSVKAPTILKDPNGKKAVSGKNLFSLAFRLMRACLPKPSSPLGSREVHLQRQVHAGLAEANTSNQGPALRPPASAESGSHGRGTKHLCQSLGPPRGDRWSHSPCGL